MENLGFCLRFLAQGCISFPELTWLALALRSCLTPASPKDWILFSVLQLFGLDRSEYKKCSKSQCCHLSEFPTPSGGWNLHCWVLPVNLWCYCLLRWHLNLSYSVYCKEPRGWPCRVSHSSWHHFSLCPGFTNPSYRDLAVCKPKTDVILSLQHLRKSQTCWKGELKPGYVHNYVRRVIISSLP